MNQPDDPIGILNSMLFHTPNRLKRVINKDLLLERLEYETDGHLNFEYEWRRELNTPGYVIEITNVQLSKDCWVYHQMLDQDNSIYGSLKLSRINSVC